MKASEVVLLIYMLAVNGTAQQTNTGVPDLTHVATALNHLTVLEFHEAVTMAAAGSPDFQIERQQNKVFIKPMKSGIATDLFVWTQSRRYAYELETTEEVKNMSFAIDNVPATPPPPITSATDDMADLMLTKAFLETEKIQSSRSRVAKDRVSVRVEQVFRTRTSLYLYFTVENKTKHLWHVPKPSATSLEARDANPALASLVGQQLDEKTLKQFGDVREFSLPIVQTEYATQDVQADGTTQGVLVIRKHLDSPCILQLTFDSQVEATVVL